MTHIDLVQAQNLLRQQADWSAKRLRRQIAGAVLLLLIGGYVLLHPHAIPLFEKLPAVIGVHTTNLNH
jgi:hypothetical protein